MRNRGFRNWIAVGCFGAALAGASLVVGAEAMAGQAGAGIAAADEPTLPILLAQNGGTTPGELEPRYPAPPPGRPGPYNDQEREVYNTDYLFAATRALVKSTVVPAAKAPLFLLTVPVDIVCLPFAAIGGFFG